jgi:hypothetical protein
MRISIKEIFQIYLAKELNRLKKQVPGTLKRIINDSKQVLNLTYKYLSE